MWKGEEASIIVGFMHSRPSELCGAQPAICLSIAKQDRSQNISSRIYVAINVSSLSFRGLANNISNVACRGLALHLVHLSILPVFRRRMECEKELHLHNHPMLVGFLPLAYSNREQNLIRGIVDDNNGVPHDMNRKTYLGLVLGTFWLLQSFISTASASTVLRYPPYDDAQGDHSGGVVGLGDCFSNLLFDKNTGNVRVYTMACNYAAGGAWASSFGFMGISLDPSGGGGGSCPYLLLWNGTDYIVDNEILPAAGYSNGSDVSDYYRLQKKLVPCGRKYPIIISEFEQEYTRIDQVGLSAVSHESNVEIAVTAEGDILTYEKPISALTAVDNHGKDFTEELSSVDGASYQSLHNDYLLLDFDNIATKQNAKLVIRSDPPIGPPLLKCPLFVQLLDCSNEWYTVATIYSRRYWTTDIVDLNPYLQDISERPRIRLCFVGNSRVDFV